MTTFVAYSLNDYSKKNPIVYLVVIVSNMDMLSKLLSMLPEQLTDKLEGNIYNLKKTDFEFYFRKEEEKEQKQHRNFLISFKSL